ncbi:MAG TPA: sigma 54-interacting transcriptional regulator, partial [Vicinamibacteria bacterium]|nr:sigma 54-interacting transcriptional regulator [Vicinamibacteria bacterium]
MPSDPRDWRGLIEAGALFAAFMDLDEVLRQALPYSAGAARAERSRLLLHDEAAGELVVAAAGGAGGEQQRGRRFPDSSGIAGAVLRSGQARIVVEPAGPVMAAPLRIGSRTLGVVEATNPTTVGGAFDAADLERFVASCSLIAIAVENASLYRRLDRETQLLDRTREDLARPLVAESPAMRRALQHAERAAAGRSTVLLVGETGTGKEQLARRIHEASPRARRPFVALNCGALPEGLLESELFGHEKGAFTGADRRRIGRFELADGGTLFLDEIGELPPAAQVKLLRVLQEREITRLGGAETVHVD